MKSTVTHAVDQTRDPGAMKQQCYPLHHRITLRSMLQDEKNLICSLYCIKIQPQRHLQYPLVCMYVFIYPALGFTWSLLRVSDAFTNDNYKLLQVKPRYNSGHVWECLNKQNESRSSLHQVYTLYLHFY